MSAIVFICVALVMSDGDSGRCTKRDGTVERIRLYGFDAGEVRPFTRCRQRPAIWACSPQAREWGPAATDRARELTRDGASCFWLDEDRYRRTVAACYVEEGEIGEILVGEGLAISDKPSGDHYSDVEEEARRARRGMWR